MIDLRDIGWDAAWDVAFAPWREKGCFPGRVALEDKQSFVVVAEAG